MGIVKPDTAGFHHVIEQLNVAPGNIAFFDDNQINVDAARSVGLVAERVVGLEELKLAVAEVNAGFFKVGAPLENCE